MLPLNEAKDLCSICLEPLEKSPVSFITTRTLNCRHVFHKACINKWIDTNASCPLCRSIHVPSVVIAVILKCATAIIMIGIPLSEMLMNVSFVSVSIDTVNKVQEAQRNTTQSKNMEEIILTHYRLQGVACMELFGLFVFCITPINALIQQSTITDIFRSTIYRYGATSVLLIGMIPVELYYIFNTKLANNETINEWNAANDQLYELIADMPRICMKVMLLMISAVLYTVAMLRYACMVRLRR